MPSSDMTELRNGHHARLASIGQIAAGIAHEVRNPLTAVKGFLQLLQEQNPHDYIDIASKELDNAILTLQNLLNVSKQDLENEAMVNIQLCAELESLLSLFQDQIYQITIEKNFENSEVEIYGRKNQLKKAFFNVLKNAFEAISDEGTIHIEHYKRNDNIIVTISDTGEGIPQDKLDLLGTPFFTTKSEGTGMGLAYVFSTVYQLGGTIDVESVEGQGTTFRFSFPIVKAKEEGAVIMDLVYEEGMQLKEFLEKNKIDFEQQIFNEAENVKDIIDEIKRVGSIDLLSNAHKLVRMIIEDNELEIINFAKQEGELWAKHSALNLAVKLEWFLAIRRVLWSIIYNFDRLSDQEPGRERFFELEKQINSHLDSFIRHFFISYTLFKDELIKTHQVIIDDLSVPIIPLSSTISIVPLLGTIDTHRAQVIQEKILHQIGLQKIKKIIIDMSGVVYLDTMVVKHLFNIMNGVSIMGCRAIVTGIRPEIANTMVSLGVSFNEKVETRGTLQQAMEEIGFMMNGN